jgi:5-methylcytosine-specific restriction protein A
MLKEVLARVALEYPTAREQPLTNHPLAEYIRKDAAQAVRIALGSLAKGLLVKGSPGQGNFAEVPWVAVFDPAVTRTATAGYYVVFLFSSDGARVALSLNQGTTAVHKEYGARYADVLRERAKFIRGRLAGHAGGLDALPIDLAGLGTLPRGYEAGHALGKSYSVGGLPSEANLVADLQSAVKAYLALTFLGGLEPSLEPEAIAGEFKGDGPGATTLEEARRYRMHMRIERNRQAGNLAKKYHGLRCQACALDFQESYGSLGAGFIEAHHLRPLSSLEEGKTVAYDVAEDFAVLCANCHRMIHRMDDPSDMDGLRLILQEQRAARR